MGRLTFAASISTDRGRRWLWMMPLNRDRDCGRVYVGMGRGEDCRADWRWTYYSGLVA